MSYFSTMPEFDTAVTDTRGGAAVGMLQELPMLELGAILLLRHWCDGEVGRAAVGRDFAALGSGGVGGETLLAELVTLFAGHGRRPLMRHGVACACFGGDEAAFAQMIAAATVGDRDDAMAFALILLPVAQAFVAVQAAGRLGPIILRLARDATRSGAAPTHH